MMQVSNINAIGSGDAVTAPLVRPAVLVGDSDVYVCPWIATARPRYSGVVLPNLRNAETCYMRGLKERLRIQTNSAHCWKWRRLCFTLKGTFLLDTNIFISNWPEVGNVRVMNIHDAVWRSKLDAALFAGTFGKDYRTFMDATPDRTLIDVKYDKTRTISSGNSSGVWRTYNLWHEMNSNIMYGDDENGDGMTSSSISTTSKPGMGDYYVLDMFMPNVGGSNSDRMSIDTTSTLYWHEK